MARTTPYRRLCTTCRDDPACTFPRAPSQPVIHCEEFMICEPHPTEATGMRSSEAMNRERVPSKAIALAKEMGLCSSCEYRETCTFPNAGKAVWSCEEYR